MENTERDTNYNRTIYFDMDGVLADFDKHFTQISGGKISDDTPDTDLWGVINAYGKAKFFSELTPMPGAFQMWDFTKKNFLNIKILSALGKSDKIDKQTTKGKLTWLRHHLPELQLDDIILVDNKHKKRHYSKPGDIIIDDTLVVIEEWARKGGIAILHKDANTTIGELEKYV